MLANTHIIQATYVVLNFLETTFKNEKKKMKLMSMLCFIQMPVDPYYNRFHYIQEIDDLLICE